MAEQRVLERIETTSGVSIFRIPLEVFSGYIAYAHLVVHGEHFTLVDTGSGFANSPDDMRHAFEEIRRTHGLAATIEGLHRIIVTHGHIDHFGGVPHLQSEAPDALITCHPLARPVLINHDERVLYTKGAMQDFMLRAGVPAEKRDTLMQMFMMGKQTYPPMRVDEVVEDGDRIDDTLEVIHVPGHAPGLIMLLIDDVLLTSDHILPETSVALFPESIMPYTGVGHFIESLEKAQQVAGVRMALGGHEWPMIDYYDVVERTLSEAHRKVERVLAHCDEPRTIYEIAAQIYDHMDGYGELLRIEQTGARVEYLNQRGMLMIDNLEALEQEHSPALRYKRV
ncbi:MAG: MBL fold metallo-hydrolase [Chloroflexi bacterium]|nr:MBL fold metallo-hydrolase [Chloroflexota bacterium]